MKIAVKMTFGNRPIIIFTGLIVIFGWWFRISLRQWFFDIRQSDLPVAVTYEERSSSLVSEDAPDFPEEISGAEVTDESDIEEPDIREEESLPRESNLAVPFITQAPNANWDAVHEEMCEEASMLMVDAYFDGRKFGGADEVESELQALKRFEVEKLGFFESTTAEESAMVFREYFEYNQVNVVYDFSLDDLRRALLDGLPIIVPAYGRALGNPNFRGEGPLYHMLVLRGFTADGKFITNDPGTRNGEEYVYDEDVLMNAIHDWNDGDVENGRKAMIVVYPNN